MSRLVYSSNTDEEVDLPSRLASSALTSATVRSRVRVVGNTVYVTGTVTALAIDRVCAAVDYLHSIGATGIRVEMDDALTDVPAPAAPATRSATVAVALTR